MLIFLVLSLHLDCLSDNPLHSLNLCRKFVLNRDARRTPTRSGQWPGVFVFFGNSTLHELRIAHFGLSVAIDEGSDTRYGCSRNSLGQLNAVIVPAAVVTRTLSLVLGSP